MEHKFSRRAFIKSSSLIIGGLAFQGVYSCNQQAIKFGWVSDIHFAEAEIKWGRYFKESKTKLSEAINMFNQSRLDFVIETGDFKDQTEPPVEEETLRYLIEIEEVFQCFSGSCYHVIGNHDVDSISKQQFLSHIQNTGIPTNQSYYYFDKLGLRFIVLDACYMSNGVDYDHNNFHWADTNISDKQISWLSNVLTSSRIPTIVFVHQRLDGNGDLYVNNAARIRAILEESKKVKAVFQGHDHEGGLNQINGILYYTQKALVDGSGLINNSYSIVTIDVVNDSIIIEGYRKADSYIGIQNKGKVFS